MSTSQQPYYYATGQPQTQTHAQTQVHQGQPVVVVQGQAVSATPVTPYVSAQPQYNHHQQQHQQQNSNRNGTGGFSQALNAPLQMEGGRPVRGKRASQRKCNDVFFAILFYVHLGVVGFCTAVYSNEMYSTIADSYGGQRRLQEENDNANGNNGDADGLSLTMNQVLRILAITGLAGFGLSTLALSFMMQFAGALIKTALLFNVILNLVIGVMALVSGATPLALVCLLAFALTACYARAVWHRIPFAAANARTAVAAVRANFGLSVLAYGALLVTFGWSVWWSLAFVSTSFVSNGCTADGCEQDPSPVVLFLFLLSYFWTAGVIKNTVHVTVAGTVGTWWFVPLEASSCCSRAIGDSWMRAMTTSFGSICFGSLVVAIIQAVKEMIHQARHSDDSMLLSCAECLVGCIERLVEYFNQWAYVFVALYGFPFMEAGSNVMSLFRERGWTAIISDTLVDMALTMVSFGVGVLNGLIGLLLVFGTDAATMGAAFVYVYRHGLLYRCLPPFVPRVYIYTCAYTHALLLPLPLSLSLSLSVCLTHIHMNGMVSIVLNLFLFVTFCVCICVYVCLCVAWTTTTPCMCDTPTFVALFVPQQCRIHSWVCSVCDSVQCGELGCEHGDCVLCRGTERVSAEPSSVE